MDTEQTITIDKSTKKNMIGEQSIFPIEKYTGGMTYRQWLVGMLLAGGETPDNAVIMADRTIELLADKLEV